MMYVETFGEADEVGRREWNTETWHNSRLSAGWQFVVLRCSAT